MTKKPTKSPMKARKGETVGGGFFVAKRHPESGRIHGSSTPFEHPDRGSAVGETRRLSKKHDGERFVVLQEVYDTAEEAAAETMEADAA